jgi:hypothetical protein
MEDDVREVLGIIEDLELEKDGYGWKQAETHTEL